MFDPEDSEAIPSKADQAAPGSGFGLGVELGVVADQGAGGLVALANLVAGMSAGGSGGSGSGGSA
ncbi:MAG: fimbrillin family protein, partial [Actinobacteria bacterium]|nr:fimbrillin family protein [Actinomycetota bacterium]